MLAFERVQKRVPPFFGVLLFTWRCDVREGKEGAYMDFMAV